MSIIDILIVVVYIVALLIMGFYISKGNETQEDYFIGGRSMPWIPIALSIAATTISANGFIGGPGWSYGSGMNAFMLQFSIPLVLLLACTIFIPFLYNLRVTSCYEYVEKRFGAKSRLLAAVGFLATSTMQISSMVYIPSLILQKITGWDLKVIVPTIVLVVIGYTIVGGIKAVIWTDAVQMVVLWAGLLATVVVALGKMDVGFFEAMNVAKEAGKFNALNFSLDLGLENGFWVALIGGTIMWLQYYTTDQSQVQRMFAAKSVKQAKTSIMTSGLIMNFMYFLFMIIGLIMFSFFNGREFASSNDVMITFIMEYLPVGFLGLMISAVFAAAMSSIDSLLNSMTTVFVKDIYERWLSKDGKTATLKHSVMFTACFGVIVAIFTLLGFSGTTSSVLATVGGYISYLCGSILAIFILGMFTRKANDAGVAIGFVAGILATAVAGTTDLNWLWYNLVGCSVSLVVGYVASCCIKEKNVTDKTEYTLKGQRALLKSQGNTMVEGASILPGTMDKYGWILLGFFGIQFVVLLMLS